MLTMINYCIWNYGDIYIYLCSNMYKEYKKKVDKLYFLIFTGEFKLNLIYFGICQVFHFVDEK